MNSVMLDLLQWPAMVITVLAAWFVASTRPERRGIGFWLFLLSNALWVAWALYAHAYALFLLQISLAAMNIRGARKSEAAQQDEAADSGGTARRAESD